MAITLHKQNPYALGFIINFTDSEEQALVPGDFVYEPSEEDITYTIKDNDDITLLAGKYLGDSKLYWVIAKVNDLLFPAFLEPGTVILIPSPSKVDSLLS